MRFLVPLILLFPLAGKTQSLLHQIAPDTTYKTVVGLQGNGMYGGNTITNDFVDKFIYGGEIDSILKATTSSNLSDQNVIGGEFTAGLQLAGKPDSLFRRTDLEWYGGVSVTRLERLDFHRDVFDLLFFGNDRFKGETASLDLTYQSTGFHKIFWGVNYLPSGIHAALAFYNGFTNTFVDSKSDFFTASDGSEITIHLATNAHFTDTTNRGMFTSQGVGAGLDLGYIYEFKQGGRLTLDIRDLGFVSWRSSELVKDSVYSYQGFDVKDLINGSVSFDNINDTLNLNALSKRRSEMIPFVVELKKHINLNAETIVRPYFGMRYRYRFNTLPEVYAGIGYLPAKSSLIYASVGYGGYYDLHMRAGIDLFFSGKIKLSIESFALLNSISQLGKGKSVSFGLTGMF